MKYASNIDLQKNQPQNAVVHPLSSAPGTPAEGQIYFDTTADTVYFYDGAAWFSCKNALTLGGDAAALFAKLASPTFTGTVSGITKAMVGLGNVDNTTDAGKPVSTAQQTALDLKANLASPTFTGTVSGITKAMVGLGNVDNTTDAGKPVSTAQQTALDLKANLASPTFTGTPAVPTAAGGTNTTQAASTAYVIAEIAARLASADAMTYKGAIDASTNPNYPAANAGDTYRISVAGKIGGASGANVEAGDLILCHVDASAGGTQASVGADWDIIQINIDGAVTLTGAQTLTNKTIALGSNTVSGTLAQFNTAVTDADLASIAGSETLTNKTLTTPTIGSFANANHNHTNSADGGTLPESALALTDVTTGNVSASAHGFAPKFPNNTTTFLRGDGTYATPAGGGSVNKYATDVGDNSATSFVITHNLGSRDGIVTVYRSTTPWDVVMCDVEMTSTTTVTLRFAVAPTSNQFRVVVTV